ncbi:MAG: putative RNA uridine N3 methyltransferase [Nitrososphaerales archaeon]
MRSEKLWVALPDTLLSDSGHLREKTVKLGAVARSCAIFRVQKIFIYRDQTERSGEASFIKTILEYLDTPQYLRRHLYGKRAELKYAGLLPPLRTPHHKLAERLSDIRRGEYREGVVVERRGGLHVDVGLPRLVPLDGRVSKGSRVTVRFTSEYPDLRCEAVGREDVDEYWGYEVSEAGPLRNLLRSINTDLLILTSRRGRPVKEVWRDLISKVKRARSITVVFGSPRCGVYEILSKEGVKPKDLSRYVLNTLPQQGAATVRTEEALLGTLAILNLAISLGKQVS